MMKKNRYMVFHYDAHYPGGGSGESIDKIFSSLDEVKNYKPKDGWEEFIEVLDLDSGKWLDCGENFYYPFK